MRRRTFLGATLAAVSLALSGASTAVRAALAHVSALRPRRRPIILFPLPKWNRTTDDIDTRDLFHRLQDCQRSLLPPDTVFPRAGQIWEAVRDCEVNVSKWIMGPNGPLAGLSTRIRTGERVRILTQDDPKPLRVTFQPVRYGELHESVAPDSLRYDLWLSTARSLVPVVGYGGGYFTELFRLVEEAA